MKISDLVITTNDFNVFDKKKENLLNNVILEAITKQSLHTIDEYSNNAIGVCLKDLINSGIKTSQILEYKKYRNSIYFMNNEFIFLYRRNNYYINDKIITNYYKSAKKCIEIYNKSCNQMEFDFNGVGEKKLLKSEKIFLIFLDFDINSLRNNLDSFYYKLYFLTIENEKITDCNDITNIQNISKVFDTSDTEKTDIESSIPLVKRKKENVAITNN